MPRRPKLNAELMDIAPLLQQAEQYAHSVNDPEKRMQLLCMQALWQLRTGDADGAEQTLTELQDAAQAIPEEWLRDRHLADCVQRLIAEGEYVRAAQLGANLLASEHGGSWAGGCAARAYRAGKRDHARAFIRYWQEHYAPIPPAAFADAIHAAAWNGAIALALELLEGAPMSADLSHPLRELAERLAQRRRFEEAMAIAERIPLAHCRLDALNTIAEQALKRGLETLARQAVQQAYILLPEAELSAQREPFGSIWRFVKLGELLLDLGDAEATRQVARQLPDFQAGGLFLNLIHFYIQRDDFEAAQRIAAESPLDYHKDSVLCLIAEHLVRTGREAEAMGFLERVSSTHQRDQALGRIAALYARQGRVDEAQATLKQIQKYGLDHALYLTTLALAEAQQFEPALQLLRACEEPYYQNEAFLKVVDAMTQLLDIDHALQLLTAHRTHRAYERGLLKLLKACLQRNDLARAQAILAQMRSDAQRAQALTAIARHHLQNGDWQTALKTAEQIPKPNSRDRMIAQIARARVQTGDPENAVRIAQRILAPTLLAETLYWIAEQTRP